MFRENTAFILGAGASKPYSYPLGSELINDIINTIETGELYLPINSANLRKPITDLGRLSQINWLKNNKGDYTHIYKQINWTKIGSHTALSWQGEEYGSFKFSEFEQFALLASKLHEFDPTSIDNFLRDHDDLIVPGRVMICYTLLKYENRNAFEKNTKTFPHNENPICTLSREEKLIDNWYRILFNNITSGCGNSPQDLFKNNLDIITFNYDMSLEYAMSVKFPRMSAFQQDRLGETFANQFNEKHINHIYGNLYPLDELLHYSEYKENHHEAKDEKSLNLARLLRSYYINKNIKLIQDRSQQDIEAVKKLNEAKHTYVLGFGFDEDNMQRLGWPTSLESEDMSKWGNGKNIYLFNYRGRMTNLLDKFKSLKERFQLLHGNLKITQSTASTIENALTLDLKTMW